MTPRELQALLINNGYSLPKFGADGFWGNETSTALQAWFKSGKNLIAADVNTKYADNGAQFVPPSWLPACVMKRIVVHWTAGGYKASSLDRQHYHIMVEGDGSLVRGDHSIADNTSTADGRYAAHTRGLNTQSIGISACCMAGARERPFYAGTAPMTQVQWLTMAKVAAELCKRYNIPVTEKTVLQHGEVQVNLGVAQAGKWDCNRLAFAPSMTPAEVHDNFRALVRVAML